MKNHSNLRAICVSPHRYIEADGKRVLDTCIALYCRGKGYLPKGERELPSQLDGMPTDVREGYFLLGMRNRDLPDCTDVSRELRVGMRIHGKETGAVGTLGGFVKLKNDEIGFLTCAHVVHPCCQRNTQAQAGSFDGHEVIYNPDTVFGCFQYGDRRQVSADAAVVIIDKSRCPSDGFMTKQTNCALRNCGFTEDNPPAFTGETVDHCEDVSLDSMLIKCGAESGLTAGLLQSDGAQVRVENAELKLQFRPSDDRVVFYNQYIVRSVKDITFFELGDSGSLVFARKRQQREDEDKGSTLLCFGMAIGHLLDGGCVVIPIHDVLQSLGLSKDDLFQFPHGSNSDDDGDDEGDNDDYPSGGNDGAGKQTGKTRLKCKREDTGKKRGNNGKILESTTITKKKESSDRSSTFGFTVNPKNTKSNKGEPQQNLYKNKGERYYLPLGPTNFLNSTVSGQLLGHRDDERNNQRRQTTNSSARREPCVSNHAYSFKGSQNDTLKSVQILERKQVFGTSLFSSNTDLPTLPSVSTRCASHDVRFSDAVNIAPSVYDKDTSLYEVSSVSPGAVNIAVQTPSSDSGLHQEQPPARPKTYFPSRENYRLLNSPNAQMSNTASYSTSLGFDSATGAQADPNLSQLENVGRSEAKTEHPMADSIHDSTDMSWQTSPEYQHLHQQSRTPQSKPEIPETSCTSANDVFQTSEELASTRNQSETHLNHPLNFNTPSACGRYGHNTEEKQVYSSHHRSPYAGNPMPYSAELILAMQHHLQTSQIRPVASVPTLSYKNDTKELTYCGDKHFSLSDEKFTFSTNQTLVSASTNTTTVVQEDIRHDSGVVKKEDKDLPKNIQDEEKQVPGTCPNKEETRTLISLNKKERSLKFKCVEGFLYFLYLVAKSYLDGYIG